MNSRNQYAGVWQIVLVAVVTALALLLAENAIERQILSKQRLDTQNQVRENLQVIQARLENQLSGNVQLASGLVAVIAANPELTQRDFEQAAKPLFDGRSLLRNIGAAPDMVIRLMYPLIGNEKAIGLDYRKVPVQRAAAERARDTGNLVLAGPLQLAQGGEGLIARIPVFVDRKESRRHFWGLVSVVIDVNRLYKKSGLLDSTLPIEVAIRGKDGKGDQGEIFYGDPDLFNTQTIRIPILLPEGSWEIAARPRGGWHDDQSSLLSIRLGFALVLVLCVGLMLSLAHFLYRRNQMELSLLKSRQQYEGLVDDIGDRFVIFSHKLTGELLYVSSGIESVFGIPRETVLGKNWSDAVNWLPGTIERVQSMLAELAEGKKSFLHFEMRFIHPDGQERTIQVSEHAIRDEWGEVTGFSGIVEEITERKKSALALQASEANYRELIDNVNAIILRMGLDGTVTYFNEYAENFFGYKSAEILGKHVVGTIVPETESNTGRDLSKMIADILANPERYAENENENITRNGRRMYVRWANRIIRDEKRKPVGLLSIGTDITSQKRAEEALVRAKESAEAASQAKSEFLANMSHEIRTPMNAILGMADILSETDLDEDQRRYVGVFQNAGNNLLELINDILDMSKIEAGQLELDKSDFSLEQVLGDLVDLHAIRAHDKRLELVLDIEPGMPVNVYGDAKRLKQCLINLVGNAIKFSSKGAIVIGVHPVEGSQDMLEFSVADNGIGIPFEKQQTIFEAFSQADTSITRQFGGTGLGLTITRRLVNLMGGEIGVDSLEGLGSTFHFTAQLPSAAQPVLADAPVDLRNVKILVVDDFPINRTIVRKYLEPLGAEVDEAESAAHALSLLEEAAMEGWTYEMALIDNQMPDINGIDLIARIRDNPQLNNLRVMLLSSADTPQQRQRARELALTFLLKPIKRHELIQSIGRELRQIAPTTVRKEQSQSEVETGEQGLRILLAEDNADNVLLIETFLKKTPHRVDVAGDGLIAVDKFRYHPYDLVLMDVQMPNMDGYEATAEIRRIEQAENRTPTRIIALTAHALKEDEQHSMDAGCNGHLTKPIKKKTLLELLASLSAGSN